MAPAGEVARSKAATLQARRQADGGGRKQAPRLTRVPRRVTGFLTRRVDVCVDCISFVLRESREKVRKKVLGYGYYNTFPRPRASAPLASLVRKMRKMPPRTRHAARQRHPPRAATSTDVRAAPPLRSATWSSARHTVHTAQIHPRAALHSGDGVSGCKTGKLVRASLYLNIDRCVACQ